MQAAAEAASPLSGDPSAICDDDARKQNNKENNLVFAMVGDQYQNNNRNNENSRIFNLLFVSLEP